MTMFTISRLYFLYLEYRMDKVNAMIKPSTGYIQVAKEKKPIRKIQYCINFQKLNETPLKLLQEKARSSSS